jgi:AcrR family transcriptional regulator
MAFDIRNAVLDQRYRDRMSEEQRTQANVPEPPWREGRKGRKRKPLTREAIVDAALHVLQREGPEGLSMRRVAQELGTGAASLYWHVAGRDELADLIVDRVASEIEVPPADPARWQEQVVEWMIQAREVMKRYPGAGALTLGRIPIGPNTVRWIEWLLGLLRGAGIPDRIAAYVGDLGGLYLGAHAVEDAMGPQSPSDETLPPEEVIAMIRGYFESLPADQFPNIHETIDDLFAGDPDERYRLGLEIIVRGIASYAESKSEG